MRKVTSHSERNSIILASRLGRMFWAALKAGSRSNTCAAVGSPAVRLAYSSAKKSRQILETHWLGFSMSMVILVRGHGSGSVERQCNNSDVSSGNITGSSPPLGDIAWLLLYCLCCVACGFCGCMYFLDERAMLIDHSSQVFTCTDGCAASAGPVLGLVLSSGSEDVPRLFLRRRGLFCVCSSVRGGFNITYWCFFDAWQVGGDNQCWMHTPPIKEVDARQRCDFLFRASLC